MDNLKRHIKEINGDFTALFFAMYMDGEWGVQVGYKVYPLWYVGMRKTLADWQLANDCCSLCTEAHKPQNTVIRSYAILNTVSDPCSPYEPLSAIGHSYNSCYPHKGSGYTKPCSYTGIGDFNNDFNSDFFK